MRCSWGGEIEKRAKKVQIIGECSLRKRQEIKVEKEQRRAVLSLAWLGSRSHNGGSNRIVGKLDMGEATGL